MGISLNLGGMQQISRAEMQKMDLSALTFMVNLARMEGTGSSLKSQLADMQENNLKMERSSQTMGLAKTQLASMPEGGSSADAIPSGEAKSNFQAAAKDIGLETKNITTRGELSTAIENLKLEIDSSSRTQQIDMLRTQSWTNSYNESVTTLTNFTKGDHDMKSAINNNMRS